MHFSRLAMDRPASLGSDGVMTTQTEQQTTLVLGGTGRVGRRIAERLVKQDVPVRLGSRSGEPPFDWEDRSTWAAAVDGVQAAYLMYYPEIEFPGASEAIGALADLAVESGVRRLVLLSARGQDEARRAEEAIERLPVEWTSVVASAFNQNFDEGVFLGPLRNGVLPVPAGDVADPFVDVNDIADVVAAALTEDGHAGQRYEVTGPRLLTFHDAVGEIAAASDREIRYLPVTQEQFAAGLVAEAGAPPEFAALLADLLAQFFDGRNASLGDGVERALGRKPRDFADWVGEVAATGVWDVA
jgi:uncharacterized protein YbjT (DUF2867 family)